MFGEKAVRSAVAISFIFSSAPPNILSFIDEQKKRLFSRLASQ